MKTSQSEKLTQSDIAVMFFTHDKIDYGPEMGFHDFEGRMFADFEGSFEFGDYDHRVSYRLDLHENSQWLNISQSIEIADFYIEIEYRNGIESIAVAEPSANVALYAEYAQDRIMKITIEVEGKSYHLVRDLEHENGIPPIFKRVN